MIVARIVRSQAFKAIDMFVKRTEHLTANMADTLLAADEQASNGQVVAANKGQPGIAESAGGAAVALAGWAFTSLSSRLGASDLSTPMLERKSSTQSVNGTAEAPPSINRIHGLAEAAISASQIRSASQPNLHASTSPNFTMPGGIGFASNGLSSARSSISIPGFAETDIIASGSGDWGGDLMDVQADEEDFDEFKSAPPVPPSAPTEPVIHPRYTITKTRNTVSPRSGVSKAGATKRGGTLMTTSKLGGNRIASVLKEIEADEGSGEWAFDSTANEFDDDDKGDTSGKENSIDLPESILSRIDQATLPRPVPLSPSKASNDTSVTNVSIPSTGKDKLAQMKEARQARLAAAKEKKAGVLGEKKGMT